MKPTTRLLSAMVLAFVAASHAAAPALADKPVNISITPTPRATQPVAAMFEQPETWQQLREQVNHFKFYGSHLEAMGRGDGEAARRFASVLVESGLGLGIEFGAMVAHPVPPGEEMWQRWVDRLEQQSAPVREAGCPLASVHVDGPVRRILGFGGGGEVDQPRLPYEQAIDQVARFYVEAGKRFPDARLGYISNLPNWDYAEDSAGYVGHFTRKRNGLTFERLLTDLYDRIDQLGGRLDFVEIDCPYFYFGQTESLHKQTPVDNIDKFHRIARWCVERNVDWTLIVNESADHPPGKPFDEAGRAAATRRFRDGTIEYLNTLHAEGLFPDQFLIQSWYTVPDQQIPESDPMTFTGVATAISHRVHQLYGAAAKSN